ADEGLQVEEEQELAADASVDGRPGAARGPPAPGPGDRPGGGDEHDPAGQPPADEQRPVHAGSRLPVPPDAPPPTAPPPQAPQPGLPPFRRFSAPVTTSTHLRHGRSIR